MTCRAGAAIAVVLGILGAVPGVGAASLAGRVLDGDGGPAARASVFIYTASVRTGTSSLCPSCYPDCRKAATTDREGRFTIPALSDSLLFRVLIVARDWEPVFVERVDPIAGPFDLRLARRRPKSLDPHHSLRGRVLDPLGRPVVGATLYPFGYRKERADGRLMRFGPAPGTDPLGATDHEGRFAIALGDSGALWFIRVRARNLAPKLLSGQPAAARPIVVRMGHGGTVTGRLLKDGRPLAGVGVGLMQARRAAQFMAYGHDEIATDERGVFTFVNVTPGEDYLAHGKMESLGAFGALDTTRVRVSGEDALAEMGDLTVRSGRRVAGQVVLADGHPVPPGTRLLLSLDHAFDAQNRTLDPDGRFDLRGVPPGDATIQVRVRGYRLAPESSGFADEHGIQECRIAVGRDVDGLRIVLEPGPVQPPAASTSKP
jgi:protocatechuate 3,4-dioxygenase beta subunit